MAKKMNDFLGHCFLSPQIARFSWLNYVFLAKLRFLGQEYLFSWLNSNSPLRFVSIKVYVPYVWLFNLLNSPFFLLQSNIRLQIQNYV